MQKLKIINKTALLTALLVWSLGTFSQVTYTRADSLKVVSLLREGLKKSTRSQYKDNLMLYYGHQLLGVPYVAATLEVNPREQLVVNLRQLDCTTYVETVLALAMTTRQGSTRWEDYCSNLTRVRYADGLLSGYASRNHYFLWWVESNCRQGIVTLPSLPSALTRRQTIHLNWMTTHTASYPMMKGHSGIIPEIRQHERSSDGRIMHYIPRQNLGLSRSRLACVQDGDILAICTRKKGLDTTHVGIAEWGSDGRLHLLNASQVHHKVVFESMTLQQYMTKHPSQLGVWVVRVK